MPGSIAILGSGWRSSSSGWNCSRQNGEIDYRTRSGAIFRTPLSAPFGYSIWVWNSSACQSHQIPGRINAWKRMEAWSKPRVTFPDTSHEH